MLENTFFDLLKKYTNDESLVREFWSEIEINYSGSKRHYHTLQHLENLLQILTPIKAKINDWDTLLFTLFYHDVIYNATKSDNEEKSAELAVVRIETIGIANSQIEKCRNQILATKKHLPSTDTDTNHFTDADLSVLGQDWETYSNYYKNVRKEYAVYPSIIYNAGRKKVLKHFLAMDKIYKTDYFYQEFEQKAKENLEQELRLL
jgi:predicted metal-dependent HD superfamily phosphohydrolase